MCNIDNLRIVCLIKLRVYNNLVDAVIVTIKFETDSEVSVQRSSARRVGDPTIGRGVDLEVLTRRFYECQFQLLVLAS
jgi:hypothetical protein